MAWPYGRTEGRLEAATYVGAEASTDIGGCMEWSYGRTEERLKAAMWVQGLHGFQGLHIMALRTYRSTPKGHYVVQKPPPVTPDPAFFSLKKNLI